MLLDNILKIIMIFRNTDVFTVFIPPVAHVQFLYDLLEKYRECNRSVGSDRFKIQKWNSGRRGIWQEMNPQEKNQKRRFIVYILQNSRSKSLVYVGCTHDPENRWMEHNGLRHYKGYKTPKGAPVCLRHLNNGAYWYPVLIATNLTEAEARSLEKSTQKRMKKKNPNERSKLGKTILALLNSIKLGSRTKQFRKGVISKHVILYFFDELRWKRQKGSKKRKRKSVMDGLPSSKKRKLFHVTQ